MVLYTDFPAGVRAKQLTDQIALLAVGDQRTFVQFWKLDSIPSIGPLRETVARDARAADVLIIATSSPGQDQPVLSAWINLLSATNSQRLVRGLLVGLCGDETTNAAEMDQVMATLFQCADRTRSDFVWQKIKTKTTPNPAWLADPLKQLVGRKEHVANQRRADSFWAEANISPVTQPAQERETLETI